MKRPKAKRVRAVGWVLWHPSKDTNIHWVCTTWVHGNRKAAEEQVEMHKGSVLCAVIPLTRPAKRKAKKHG